MRKIVLCFIVITTFLLPAFAQKDSKPAMEGMKTYYLVFLKKGPNRTQDSATAAKIQEAHLAHLGKMAKEGKLQIAGPLLDQSDIRGICIYSAESLEEVTKLANEDPAVQAGRLLVEVHPWMSKKGAKLD